MLVKCSCDIEHPQHRAGCRLGRAALLRKMTMAPIKNVASKCRRRAGADDFAGDRTNASEAVWTAAFKVIGVPRTENLAFVIDGDFQPAGQNDAAFLAVVNQGNLAG